VPFNADDSLAVGIMYITQPVPMLPEHLSPLQSILSRLLAKQPDERYQNGAQLADAIEQIEIAIANGDLPQLADAEEAYRHDVPGADQSRPNRNSGEGNATRNSGEGNAARNSGEGNAAISERPTTPAALFRRRSDPSLGRLEGVVATGGYRPSSRREVTPSADKRAVAAKRAPRRGWIFAVAAIVIVLGAAAAWRYQDRLRALIPNTELNSLVGRGQKALDEGRLVGNKGDSARELFQSARALDPDNDQAREGLNKVGERLLDDTRSALAQKDLATARSDLATADEILGGGAKVEELKNALHSAETGGTQVDDLLQRADSALAAGRLLGNDSASALYTRVLDADKGNALASSGLAKVAKAQAQAVRDAISDGNADLANQRIADLAQLAPNHPAIPELRTALAQMRGKDTKDQDQNLARAESALHENRLAGGDGALALFQAAIKRNPNNPRAKAGLRKVGLAFATQAGVQLDANNLPAAETALHQAEALGADAAEVRSLRARLREMREGADIVGKQAAEPSLADRARIEDALGEADRALAAGSLMDPGGAYDKYRAVLRTDVNNTRALAGINRIPARARELFDEALGATKPNAARGYLEAIAQTDPGNANLAGMRERLASLYLDQAEARIGQGQRDDAQRALKAARELNPTNPRIATVESKLQSAAATGG
jgi:tetratricopeptide (TPR) repeat protein